MNHPIAQIPFDFGGNQKNDLDAFLPGQNATLLSLLNSILNKTTTHHLYLWGETGVGKTHLLQAVCKRASEFGQRAAYIPLKKNSFIVAQSFY